MLPHEHGNQQHRGHAGAEASSAETRGGHHALKRADPELRESSSFQEGERETGADHGDGDLPKRIPYD